MGGRDEKEICRIEWRGDNREEGSAEGVRWRKLRDWVE